MCLIWTRTFQALVYQEQIPVAYQTVDQFIASVLPIRELEDDLVQVYNYANQGEVNGPNQVTDDSFKLLGEIPDLSDPAKLQVGISGPFGNGPIFSGPYWVVAIDETDITDPQWAIVTGGHQLWSLMVPACLSPQDSMETGSGSSQRNLLIQRTLR
eukprot:jgi/Picre1/27083/NNA_000053.t1